MGPKRSDEFRQDAVHIAPTSGLTRKQVADDLGVPSLRSDFRMAEFFNRMGGELPFAAHGTNGSFRCQLASLNSAYSPRTCTVTVASELSRLRQNQPCSPSNAATISPSSPVEPRPFS